MKVLFLLAFFALALLCPGQMARGQEATPAPTVEASPTPEPSPADGSPTEVQMLVHLHQDLYLIAGLLCTLICAVVFVGYVRI